MQVTVKAYAKINLSLDITGKRQDGYHTVRSVMQSVSLCDKITISLPSSDGIMLTCSDGSICGENNLAFLAAERFFSKAGINPCAEIFIEKHIPLAAGLGGGSADAAVVLRLLNKLWEEPLSEDELFSIALSLGADVPFCLIGGTKLAEGIGEQLTGFCNMPDCLLLIAKKGVKTSTGDMYRALDTADTIKNSDLNIIKNGFENKNIKEAASGFYNCFETVCGQESLAVKQKMYENGALYAGLSGAGPSVFGIFSNDSERKACADSLAALGCEVFYCQPENSSYEILI